jgi:hypothetical protein
MTDNSALFELTRLQILSMQAQRKCFPDAYAHAWNQRIFPVLMEQPRDRAFEDDRSWNINTSGMIMLQQRLMTLPGYRKALDIDEFAAAARGKAEGEMSNARDLLDEVSRSRGGFAVVVAGCRYYRMQGQGSPDFWTALARSHPDLRNVAHGALGISEFEY